MECLYTFEAVVTPKAMRRALWYFYLRDRRRILYSVFCLAILGYMGYRLWQAVLLGSLFAALLAGGVMVWALVQFPLNPVSVHRIARQEFRYMEPGEERICYEFYDTFYIRRTCVGYTRWEYRELRGILLKKDLLILQWMTGNIWPIPGETLPEGLLQFLLNAGVGML